MDNVRAEVFQEMINSAHAADIANMHPMKIFSKLPFIGRGQEAELLKRKIEDRCINFQIFGGAYIPFIDETEELGLVFHTLCTPDGLKSCNGFAKRFQKLEPSEGFIYFVKAKESNLVKIGFADTPYRRIMQVQRLCPVDLYILTTMNGHKGEEHRLHKRFAHLREYGEWFVGTEELMSFIEEVKSRKQA